MKSITARFRASVAGALPVDGCLHRKNPRPIGPRRAMPLSCAGTGRKPNCRVTPQNASRGTTNPVRIGIAGVCAPRIPGTARPRRPPRRSRHPALRAQPVASCRDQETSSAGPMAKDWSIRRNACAAQSGIKQIDSAESVDCPLAGLRRTRRTRSSPKRKLKSWKRKRGLGRLTWKFRRPRCIDGRNETVVLAPDGKPAL